MGSVTVERRKAVWRDLVRKYTVTIDGRAAGKLASGESETFDLTPGPHQVKMTIDWCGSPTVTVDGATDSRVVCDSGGNSLMAAIDAIFRPGKYISLVRADMPARSTRPLSSA